MSTNALNVVFYIALLSISEVAFANKAHTHGVADLTLAYERGVVEIQFELPAESVLGFEHQPKTQAQADSVDRVKEILNSPEKLLSFANVSCSADTVEVDILGPAGQDLDIGHNQEHDHHEDADSDNHHEDADNDDHHAEHEEDAEGHHDQVTEGHSEVRAMYIFSCNLSLIHI